MQLDEVVASTDYLVLVVNTVQQGAGTVQTVSAPLASTNTNQASNALVLQNAGIPISSVQTGANLVTHVPESGQTLIESAPTTIAASTQTADSQVLEVNIGTPGAPGTPGPAGFGNLFIQNSAPVSPPPQYVWVQTDYPSAGNQTVWVNY